MREIGTINGDSSANTSAVSTPGVGAAEPVYASSSVCGSTHASIGDANAPLLGTRTPAIATKGERVLHKTPGIADTLVSISHIVRHQGTSGFLSSRRRSRTERKRSERSTGASQSVQNLSFKPILDSHHCVRQMPRGIQRVLDNIQARVGIIYFLIISFYSHV